MGESALVGQLLFAVVRWSVVVTYLVTIMVEATARHRVIALVLYAITLMVVHYFVVQPSFLPSAKVLWFYNGTASLLFGSRLLNPHFTPPAGAATNGFFVILAMLAASLAITPASADIAVVVIVGLFGAVVLLTSIFVLLVRAPAGLRARPWLIGLDKIVRTLGSPTVIYTTVILAAVWLFHIERPMEVFAILGTWTVIVALGPVEGALRLLGIVHGLVARKWSSGIVGVIAAHQSPGMVLIRQPDASSVESGTPLLILDDHGSQTLAVALNYVGRDEGNLLRALTFPVPANLQPRIDESLAAVGVGVAVGLEISERDADDIPDSDSASILKRMGQFCGIVDEGTTLESLQFEVIEDRDLAEGCLVEAEIAGEPVLFQVIEGITREEIVQQKNKYGYARARARKIGRWNPDATKFEAARWLPRINAPVLLKETEETATTVEAVGHLPGTAYTVGIDISEAVTHNTAILGVLGIGKSFLAIELVERMIAASIKVICLDLTNQYAEQLPDFLDSDYEKQKFSELNATGGRGASHQDKEEGGTKKEFKAKVAEQLREFLDPNSGRYLRVCSPTQYDVWQQTGGQYKGSAAMASLTPCEITAIISECALEIAQEMGMTDTARICLVYEEAHSLVPEWHSIAAEGDKAATAATARAILQGRKYGLGCLLVTQRTANVTKTILNQCNTIFAMRIFDDTGKSFLSNYIGGDYTAVLSSLEARHAVVFGKSSTCHNPVLIRLNDRMNFLNTFRQENSPRPLPVKEKSVEPVVPSDEVPSES